MKGGTLAGRIFFALAATLAVLFAVAALWGESRIRGFHRSEVERRLDAVAGSLLGSARGWLSPGGAPGAAARDLSSLRIEGPFRVTVVAADGTVLADSVAPLPLRNHLDRPEVQTALRRDEGAGRGVAERASDTTGVRTLYVALLVEGAAGESLGVLRVAEPLEQVEAEVATLRGTLLLGGASVLVLGLVVSALLARLLSLPLREMERSAAAIAAGDLEGRAAVAGPVEVERLGVSLQRMAEQIRERIGSERRARGELESVLAGMMEGVVAVDASGRVLFMNAAAARLLGLPAPLPPGAATGDTVLPPDLEQVLRAALGGRAPDPRDVLAPGGGGRTLEIEASPLGTGGGAVAMVRDVTGERRLDRMRMEFVANVSHEIRTPLSAVLGALETLEEGGLDDAERRAFLEIARRNASRLMALVQDLLDLSAIESKESNPALGPLDPAAVLRSAAGGLGELARRASVDLRIEPAPGPGILVAGTAPRLEQAFVNLLENALKYTPSGGRVTARVLDRGPEVAVEIEDTGVGIPAAALPRIFERFYRVDPSRSRAMGGTGLGLAIVKHIVLSHRGRIEVRSVEGSGTTFTVHLPKPRVAEPPRPRIGGRATSP